MNDLETRLSAAGRSLRESAELTADLDAGWTDLTARLRADSGGAVVVRAGDRFDHPPVQRHRWLAAAAAIVVVIGAAATFVALTDPTDDPTADPVATPTEPLFLLPAPGSGYEVSAGFVRSADDIDSAIEATADLQQSEGIVLGARDGEGFVRLVEVGLRPWRTPQATGPDVEEIEIDTQVGSATISRFGRSLTMVVQRRGDLALELSVRSAEEELAVEVLEAAAIVDGHLEISDPPGDLVEIERVSGRAWSGIAGNSFSAQGNGIDGGDEDGPAYVEVAEWPVSLLVGAVTTSERVERTDVGGRDGWISTRADGWVGIVWRAETGHLVAVSGHESVEWLVALAESLVPVDETTWRTATNARPESVPATSPNSTESDRDVMAEPGTPLFLLPSPESGLEVSGGDVYLDDPELVPADATLPVEHVAFGIPDGGGFADPLVIQVFSGAIPDVPADASDEYERRLVETSAGPAVLESQGPFWRRVAQQRDGSWMSVQLLASVPDSLASDTESETYEQLQERQLDQALSLFESMEVVGGSVQVTGDPGAFVEIGRGSFPFAPGAPTISFRAAPSGTSTDDEALRVETIGSPDLAEVPLASFVARNASLLTPVEVAGIDGWAVTREGGERGLVWRLASGHLVGVSGNADSEELMRVAESLVAVDEATWRAATGAGPAPTTTTTSPP